MDLPYTSDVPAGDLARWPTATRDL